MPIGPEMPNGKRGEARYTECFDHGWTRMNTDRNRRARSSRGGRGKPCGSEAVGTGTRCAEGESETLPYFGIMPGKT